MISQIVESDTMLAPSDWMEEAEGQLAVDVYMTAADIIIKAPVAGVKQEDLDVSITEERVSIRGERHENITAEVEEVLTQECYWGAFSRTYMLPVAVDPDKTKAKLENGILTIIVPKALKSRTRSIQIETN